MEIEVPKLKKNDSIAGLKETSKNRKMISKLQGNPARLQGLKESFKYFTLLKKNQYLERKQYKLQRDEALVCNCQGCSEEQFQLRSTQGSLLSFNCGERCLNRFTCTECDVEFCPCGEFCKNRRFQKHDDACVYPLKCGGKGMGLFAGERIVRGQFIMQYIGEIFYINSALGRRRVSEYSKSTCTYLMKLNNHEVIDPTYKGNLARFINHSCEPNCITEKWNVLGEVCIGIFAIRDIQEDEELTFDYQFDVFHTPLTKCLCGANKCKGYLGLKPTHVTQEEWDEHLENMVCKICQTKTPSDDESLLLCDKCNCGFHLTCLSPPLEQVPKDAWYCQECLDEQRIMQEQEQEKEKIDGILQQKIKSMKKQNAQSSSSSSDSSDISSSSSSEEESEKVEDYNKRYKEMKKLEKETTRELLKTQEQSKLQQQKSCEQPKKQQQMQIIVDIADQKFFKQFQENVELQEKIKSLEESKQNLNISDTIKECFRVNLLEQKVVKKNAPLIYQIGNKTSFEQLEQQSVDFFKKENDLTVIGTVQQIEVFRCVLQMIESIIKDLKKEMGIIEGSIRVPIIYLKRLITQFSNIEMKYEVNVIYNKSLSHSEEIFPMDRLTPIKIKGSKQNIEGAVSQIQDQLSKLFVHRLYISRSETKIVQQNMYLLRQNNKNSEIRISRDSVYNARGEQTQRDINHPFFYIQYREKEVCLIGTLEQIDQTGQVIRNLLEQETNNDKEMTYFTVLIATTYKENCKQIKQNIEKNSISTKVLLFEASHPRKNMTILILCLRSQIQQTKQLFSDMVFENCGLKLDHFQDQMSMQMCRYVFKYLQNTMMTQDMAFMKNWDLITPYFYSFNIQKYREQKGDNWFIKRCYASLQKDYETQLYIQYALGKEIQGNLTENEKSIRRKNLLYLMKRILNGILGYKRNTIASTTFNNDNNNNNVNSTFIEDFNKRLEESTPLLVQKQSSQVLKPVEITLHPKNNVSSSSSSSSESNSKDSRSSGEQEYRKKQQYNRSHYRQHRYSSSSSERSRDESKSKDRYQKYKHYSHQKYYDKDKEREKSPYDNRHYKIHYHKQRHYHQYDKHHSYKDYYNSNNNTNNNNNNNTTSNNNATKDYKHYKSRHNVIRNTSTTNNKDNNYYSKPQFPYYSKHYHKTDDHSRKDSESNSKQRYHRSSHHQQRYSKPYIKVEQRSIDKSADSLSSTSHRRSHRKYKKY